MTSTEHSRTYTDLPSVIAGETGHAAYVDWGAILAGAVVAAAISTLFTTFGAAIGLAAVSPFSGKGFSATAMGVATALWVLWIAVSSFVAGGYLAGRMRRRIHDASEHESDVRDGAHGLIVWAIGALLIAYLATATVVGLTKAAAGAASGGAAAMMAGTGQKMAEAGDPLSYAADRLWRPASPSTSGAGAGAGADAVRLDGARILATSAANGSISEDDKAYLVARIASHTGVSAQEAGKRVDDTIAQINAGAEKLRQAAETARKTGVLVAFLTAASLAVSAAAAWWAATMGGKHRDEGVGLSHLMAWH